MLVSSKKAKARRLQNYVAQQLRELFPELTDTDIRPAIMGETGTDIKLSAAAQAAIPFDIEAKNQERLNIWQAIVQAKRSERIPLLVIKKNQTRAYAVLPLEDLLRLWKS